jgi:DNA-binding GntR family transcriptional regulator
MSDESRRLAPAAREALERTARSRVAAHGLATRARIVLDCAEFGIAEAARRSEVSQGTAGKWWHRYLDSGIDGLADTARAGRPAASDDTVGAVLKCALLDPPAGSRRWSTHAIADATGISQATVSRIRRRFFPRPDPGVGLLSDSATAILAYVDADAAGCALGLHPARSSIARSSPAPAVADAIETIICSALLRRPHDGYGDPGPETDPPRAITLLRRAAARLPPFPPVTLLIDVELDEPAQRWLADHPEFSVHPLAPEAWLAAVHRIADTVDPRQLQELQYVQRGIRAAHGAGETRFTWLRTDEPASERQPDDTVAEPADPAGGDQERVIRAVCAAIADGELSPGDPVTVRSVVRRAGISAGRATEAMAHLADEALLDRRGGRCLVPVPQPRDVIETYTARGLLGTAIARRLASADGDLPPIIEALHARLMVCDRHGWTAEAYLLDLDFQNEIARAASMPRIGWMFVQLSLQLRLFVAIIGLDYQYPTGEIVRDGQRILDTIRGSDVEAAVAAWRAKVDNCAHYMLQYLKTSTGRQYGSG